MSRIKKLRNALSSSPLPKPEQELMAGALNKCLAHAAHDRQKAQMETLLAFGKRKGAAKLKPEDEVKFRLYARLAICLLGYISLPPQTREATELKKDCEKDANYGNVAWAQARYARYKALASVVQNIAPVAVVDVDQFAAKVNLSKDVVSKRINDAVRTGNVALRFSIDNLKKSRSNADLYAERWFGKGSKQQLIQNLERLYARSTDIMRPIFLEYEDKDVWGTSHASSRSINFGRKFFDDARTHPTSNLGREYVARPEQVRNVREVTSDYAVVVRRDNALATLTGLFKYASGPDTMAKLVEDHARDSVQYGQAKGRTVEEFTSQMSGDLAALGFAAGDNLATMKGKVKAAGDRVEAAKREVAARQGELSLMEITGFGCYVHELTHMVLDTQDLESDSIGVPGQKVYGPLLCQMLASQSPQRALNNADNYRHFVECWWT